MVKNLILFASLFSLQVCLAEQSKYYTEHGLLHFNISRKELNVIRVDDDRITGAKLSNDNLEIDKDEEGGQLFVKTKPDVKGPITVFLTTEQGKTIGLNLQPHNSEAETISIKMKPVNQITHRSTEPHNEQVINREREILQLVKAMYNQIELEGFDIDNNPHKPCRVNQLKVQKLIEYKGEHLKGYHYVLENRKDHMVNVTEQEFSDLNVLAVALSHRIIEPGQVLHVLQVKGAS